MVGAATIRSVQADELAAADFFEQHVRPILVGKCIECHGPDAQEAGLRLDSAAALQTGSSGGPVVEAGNPDRSRLITVLRYTDDVQMPPDGKLPAEAIEVFEQWVRQGAVWPATATSPEAATPSTPAPSASADTVEKPDATATHWAFQPIRLPQPPAVARAEWCAQPIDHFILARLEAQGLAPSPPADRRTLLRRASFDLLGLPPTAADVEQFERDHRPDAWERLVDRLLASPHYGERWGRHWLDVARYADTKGYVFTQDPRYVYAYTYRDYVIQSLNADLPFDRFVIEQLAADQVAPPDDPRPLAALGFLTLGRRFAFNVHEIIDDRIDVVTRGLMGLTVGCARCHDHKYDPIPMADYYSLYGVFASCEEPDELPLIAMPAQSAAFAEEQQKLDALRGQFKARTDLEYDNSVRQLRQYVADYLVQAVRPAGVELTEMIDISLAMEDIRPVAVRRWKAYLKRRVTADDPVFAIWNAFERLPAEQFAAASEALRQQLAAASDSWGSVNRLAREALAVEPAPRSMLEVAQRYGRLLTEVDRQWQAAQQLAADQTAGGQATPAPTALPDEAAEQLRQVLYADDSPTTIPREELRKFLDRATVDVLNKLRNDADAFEAAMPDAPPRANVLRDRAAPVQPKVFLRGDPNRPGPETPRQFLAVATSGTRTPFATGSGRLEMARAVVDPANPLTARVIANRVWKHHFGAGLVRTPSDFGTRAQPPSHPELLDYLAATLRDDGWSLKRLHRRVLLSSAYQQASDDRDDCRRVDPENQWLWRMNRRRLEFEALRDSLARVAGHLDATQGGRAVNLFATPAPTRRAVYATIDRQDLPGTLRVFDFANPDATAPERPETTVPQQALWAMNSPYVIEQAKRLAQRAEEAMTDVDHDASAENRQRAKIAALYRIALARAPERQELAVGLAFLATATTEHTRRAVAAGFGGGAKPSSLRPWERYAQALLMSNEFSFVD